MALSNLIRVAAAALALSTLSFAAGVAGDLTTAANPTSGVSVVLRIPPELPVDTPRAAPLPRLTQTAAAAELPRQRIEPREPVVEARVKPPREQSFSARKSEPDRAPKASQPVQRRKGE